MSWEKELMKDPWTVKNGHLNLAFLVLLGNKVLSYYIPLENLGRNLDDLNV